MVAKNVRDVGLDPMQNVMVTLSDWPLEFERLQRSIIELWQTCNISLVHRTYFILLFKGDSTDSIYMKVELRRLSFVKETFSRENAEVDYGRTLTLASRSSLPIYMHVACRSIFNFYICFLLAPYLWRALSFVLDYTCLHSDVPVPVPVSAYPFYLVRYQDEAWFVVYRYI